MSYEYVTQTGTISSVVETTIVVGATADVDLTLPYIFYNDNGNQYSNDGLVLQVKNSLPNTTYNVTILPYTGDTIEGNASLAVPKGGVITLKATVDLNSNNVWIQL